MYYILTKSNFDNSIVLPSLVFETLGFMLSLIFYTLNNMITYNIICLILEILYLMFFIFHHSNTFFSVHDSFFLHYLLSSWLILLSISALDIVLSILVNLLLGNMIMLIWLSFYMMLFLIVFSTISVVILNKKLQMYI